MNNSYAYVDIITGSREETPSTSIKVVDLHIEFDLRSVSGV